MAINRSQDYVKASSGISLTPMLETFNVKDVLGIVHKCMVNTKVRPCPASPFFRNPFRSFLPYAHIRPRPYVSLPPTPTPTQCGRIINMHPLNDVCPFLITDR